MNKEEKVKKAIAAKLKMVAENKLDHITVDSRKDWLDNKAALKQAAATITIPTQEPTSNQASATMPGVEANEEVVKEEDEVKGNIDGVDIPDEEKAEREMNENEFDAVMEELSKKNGIVVDIAENVNPRIKKGDLIKYLNSKKEK